MGVKTAGVKLANLLNCRPPPICHIKYNLGVFDIYLKVFLQCFIMYLFSYVIILLIFFSRGGEDKQ